MESSPTADGPRQDGRDTHHASPAEASGGEALEAVARKPAKPAGEATTHPPLARVAVAKPRSGSARQYEKLGEIARGGMGAILKVQDNDLRRLVAMKVMLGDDRAMRARFVEEAQVTGQLEHPGIVPVHEMGADHDGRPYFTMKLVKGRSLAQIFKKLREGDEETAREFSLPRLVRILVDVANAIAFAHHKGVLHRDLKPANIMIGRFGEVLVMDWGLAKVAVRRPTTAGAEPPPPTVDDEPPLEPSTAGDGTTRLVSKHGTQAIARRQTPEEELFAQGGGEASVVTSDRSDGVGDTRAGQVAGTPAYMAPEQARGDTARIDRRSDVYALGALLYECLTLGAPVRGRSTDDLIDNAKAGRIERPELRAPGRAIPAELSAIALKALHHSQFRRYQWVEDFRRDLELYLDGRSVSAKADSTWEILLKLVRRNRAASLAIGVLGTVIMALTAVFLVVTTQALHHEERERQRAQDALAAVTAEQQGRHVAERAAGPALIAQARASIVVRAPDEALSAIDLALHFDPELDEAYLLRAQLLACRHEFALAAAALERMQGPARQDPNILALGRLCLQGAKQGDSSALGDDLAVVLVALGSSTLAEGVTKSATRLEAAYRQRLDKAWPGAGAHLTALGKGRYRFETGNFADLTPLHGLPLIELVVRASPRLQDLSPLTGMPLTSLVIQECPLIHDLHPLAGMPLTHLELRKCDAIDDLAPLRGMPLNALMLPDCPRLRDLSPLAGMRLTMLDLDRCHAIASLAPLAGMPIANLHIAGMGKVEDFSPLGAMPLVNLWMPGCSRFADLKLLASAPLEDLEVADCPLVTDLSPLAGKRLHYVGFSMRPELTGLEGLRSLPAGTTILGLPASEFWRRYDMGQYANPATH